MVLSQELGFIAKSTKINETQAAQYSPIDEENARIKWLYHIRETDFDRKFPEERFLLYFPT